LAAIMSAMFNQSPAGDPQVFNRIHNDHLMARYQQPWNWQRLEYEYERNYEIYREHRRNRAAGWATMILIVLGLLAYQVFLQ
jgi:hypothetical protein